MIDKLIEQQETIKGMQENEESAIKIMKMYEDLKKNYIRVKSNEKTLADLLDKEQKKNKKAIEYIETLKINEYDSQGYWIRHNADEDLSIEKTIEESLELLKGGRL